MTIDAGAAGAAAQWLSSQLDAGGPAPSVVPRRSDEFAAWSAAHTDSVGEQYKQYLAERKSGAPRRFFSSKSHALYFLKGVAPTKLVDGAWLFGLLQHWEQGAMRPLITTYLEELGNGVPEKNHVVIFQQLIDAHGCAQWQGLSEDHFVQGLIQLAMAYNADQFLPELIGYNLGYEQLPLHLLITAYELNELGIDPYYFTLHVTVDNADSGHARKAWEALQKLMPQVGDADEFMRRVDAGYRLNDLGASTSSVIDSFDLHAELVGILRAKSAVGKNMHSDYCQDRRPFAQRLAVRSRPDPGAAGGAGSPGLVHARRSAGREPLLGPDPGRPRADVRRLQRLRAAGAARLDRHAAAPGSRRRRCRALPPTARCSAPPPRWTTCRRAASAKAPNAA